MTDWHFGETYRHRGGLVVMVICPTITQYSPSPDCIVISGASGHKVGTISQWGTIRKDEYWTRVDTDELETP